MHGSNNTEKIWVGFITYGEITAPYLPYFLQSLYHQTYTNLEIVCFDNTPEAINENTEILEAHSEITVFREDGNTGFSHAYNVLLNKARAAHARYFLIINPDTLLEPDVIDRLVSSLEANPHYGSVSPKIHRWNFTARTKTSYIDSCGLVLKNGLQFSDLGQGEEDRSQYDANLIMGASGAAGLFRLEALAVVAENGKYFDEYFFMYKEDCDLAYRLNVYGYTAKLVPQALVYHDRTATGGSFWQRFAHRHGRSKVANRYSFINQHFLYIKYWSKQEISGKLKILIWVCIRFFEALILEQYLLGSYPFIFKGLKVLKKY